MALPCAVHGVGLLASRRLGVAEMARFTAFHLPSLAAGDTVIRLTSEPTRTLNPGAMAGVSSVTPAL